MLLALLHACPPPTDTAVPEQGSLPDGVVGEFTCNGPAGTYDEGSPAYVEASTDWGLDGITASNMITVDLDGDGYPDLLVNEADGEKRDDPAGGVYSHRVLMNRASGDRRVFVDETDASGLLVGESAGMDADDNLDYSDNYWYACYCETHGCDPEPTVSCGGSFPDNYWTPGYDDHPSRLGGNTFTTVCADIDNDGDLDLYHTEIHHLWAGQSGDGSQLLLNDGSGHFERADSAENGLERVHSKFEDWNEGDLFSAFFDYDADGWKDILLVESDYPDDHLYAWHNEGDGTFTEVSDTTGLNQPWPHGAAIADFDRDGDLDVVTGSSHARSGSPWTENTLHLYENRLGGNLLRIAGLPVGTRVDVEAGGMTQTFEVSGGYGVTGQQHEVAVYVGLGDACSVDDVSITPLSGETTHSGSLSGS